MAALPRTVTAAVLLVVVGIGLVAGTAYGLGITLAPLLVGLVSGMAIAYAVTRALSRRKAAPRARPARVLPGGRRLSGSYDLAKDRSTDDQRWLM